VSRAGSSEGSFPRNAENRLPTGGRFAMAWAWVAPTPWALSPLNMALGSVFVRPTIINEKKTRWKGRTGIHERRLNPGRSASLFGGQLFMIAAWFGAENIPPPTPLKNTMMAKTQ